jgi:uncharacterized protein (TIGR02452 family)
MSLSGVAKETLAIVERGGYQSGGGKAVALRAEIDRAVSGTALYRPEELDILLSERLGTRGEGRSDGSAPRIEVSEETTAAAARRLLTRAGEARVCALNFASARNPGGGFLGGAKAQEEDLARCSALYTCLLTQREYYDVNRATSSLLYTDHIIYAPEVPFFRDDRLELIDEPFFPSIITAPAPNAGQFLRHEGGRARGRVREALERRAAKVLAVAADQGHRCLVLGAWGCGVFQNIPSEVAEVFATWLAHPGFAGAFDRVVFGIYDRSKEKATLEAFRERFASW